MSPPDRKDEVRAALDSALDPELDESVVALGFIAAVSVDGGKVAVDFRLPTFWCSATFAWIMAEDMQAALRALPWVEAAEVRLVDHFAAGRINRGVAAGETFRSAFAGEAAGNLGDLRETFRRKAYQGRMSRLVEHLREQGWRDEDIVALTVAEVSALAEEGTLRELAGRFLELRRVYGGPSPASAPAFAGVNGEAITAATLPAVLRDIRMTRRSAEANGEMCRMLLKARIEAPAPAEP